MAKSKIAGLTIEIGGDTTELSKALKQPNSEARDLQSKLKAIDQALKFDPNNTELLEQKFRLLGQAIDSNEQKLQMLKIAQEQFKSSGKDIDSSEYIELQRQIALTTNKVDQLRKQRIDMMVDTSEVNDANRALDDMEKNMDDVEKSSSTFRDALKGAIVGSGVVEGVKGLVSSLSDMAEESKENIKIMSSLETSSKLAGYSATETSETYKQLYGVLGDNQTAATTTANLQALGLEQDKLRQITEGAIGAWAKYGDSIPIDGLAESINETVKTATVTGNFADVLNWAGTNEDDFNAKLQKANSTSERANIVLQELTKQGLIKSADAWRENAGALVDANEAQAEFEQATSQLSQVVLPITSKIQSGLANMLKPLADLITGNISFEQFSAQISNGLMSIMTSITTLAPQFIQKGLEILTNISLGFAQGFPVFLSNVLTLIQNFGNYLTQNAPTIIQKGFEILSNLVQGIINALPVLISQVPQIITTFANVINDNFPIILMKGAELLWQLITGILSAIPDLIANIPQIIEAIVSSIMAFQWLNLGKNIMNFFGNGIKSMRGWIETQGKEIFNNVLKWLKDLPKKLFNLGKTMIQNFGNSIKNTTGTVGGAVKGVFNAVINGFKSLPSKMISIGKDLVRGIWNGIGDMTGWIIDKIGGFADSVVDSICSFFGIASPSKVMKKLVGKNIAAGIGVGITDNENLALNPLRQLEKEMTSSFNPKIAASVTQALNYNGTITVESPIQVDLDGKPIYNNVVRRITKNQGNRMAFQGV
ncbi:MAG: hypothetical protein KHY19_08055 [Coprobacillus cateniformis]|nr:hypothetical protein [Coprobacillus cateniformis]